MVVVRLRGCRRWETCTVGFDNAHLMSIDPEVECDKGGSIDDSEAIGAARDERQGRILVETYCRSDRRWGA